MGSETPIHPGTYVKERVLPLELSISDAAKLLGIGRPALSNFLNAKAALSAEMAIRIQRVFGTNKDMLLDLQRSYDLEQKQSISRNIAVATYVPNFLTIKARQIDLWASELDTRSLLPVLLRILVKSTASEVTKVDFPGYDNAQSPGWDGYVDNSLATLWIPQGLSGWEFGCNGNPKSKAEKDYEKRTQNTTKKERAVTTFIFVTPRNWPSHETWEKEKKATGEWKDVRVYDAGKLEQWLEQSVSGQIFLADKLKLPTRGLRTLSQCWQFWSSGSLPDLPRESFQAAVEQHREYFISWLSKSGARPLEVAAESKDEALAFLSCLFEDPEISKLPNAAKAAVFDSAESLRELSPAASSILPIVHTPESEKELSLYCNKTHCITVKRKGSVRATDAIILDQLSPTEFRKLMHLMNFSNDKADQIARSTGRSMTVLRRLLSTIPAIKSPNWAQDDSKAHALVPFALASGWSQVNGADQEILSLLSHSKYTEIEKSITDLMKVDDSPIWSTGSYTGVTSKIDVLFAVHESVTKQNLFDFFDVAQMVLSEPDPVLELPEAERFFSAIHGKTRKYTQALRRSICDTLIILSIYGNDLFQTRLGIDVERTVNNLVRTLLTPLSAGLLMSFDKELPLLAEAAPEEFLRLIFEDLRTENPIVMSLMKPATSDPFGSGSCWRTSLLWGLECLAWNNIYFIRVASILARLCQKEIDDNWLNKPENSLKSLFRWWMPQTAANTEEKIKVLNLLSKEFDKTVWNICIAQFTPYPDSAHDNYRPLWRNDGTGAGHPSGDSLDRIAFRDQALNIALNWKSHDENTLGDLIERLPALDEATQVKVWDIVDQWCQDNTNEQAKSSLRDRIRQLRVFKDSKRNISSNSSKARARNTFDKLCPSSPVLKHRWLFEREWIDDFEEEDDDDDDDYKEKQPKIDYSQKLDSIYQLRSQAIQEIWSLNGTNGIIHLSKLAESARLVGFHVAQCVVEETHYFELLSKILSSGETLTDKARDELIFGLLHQTPLELRVAVLKAHADSPAMTMDFLKLLVLSPFNCETWNFLETQPKQIQTEYWKAIHPRWGNFSKEDIQIIIDKLIEVNRPIAAFNAVCMDRNRIDTPYLTKLLKALLGNSTESEDNYKLSSHYVAEVFDVINQRSELTVEEMAQLEFQFIAALERTKYGIPNLEKQLAHSPELFMHAVALSFNRDDDGIDPEEWRIEDQSKRSAIAMTCFRLLDRVKRLPGYNVTTKTLEVKELRKWILQSQKLLSEHGRKEVGNQLIGQYLARDQTSTKESWPSQAVCEVLEEFGTDDLATGFKIQMHNSRGVTSRGLTDGGQQERELAEYYRARAKQVAFNYPYVSSILEELAKEYEREALIEDAEVQVRNRFY